MQAVPFFASVLLLLLLLLGTQGDGAPERGVASCVAVSRRLIASTALAVSTTVARSGKEKAGCARPGRRPFAFSVELELQWRSRVPSATRGNERVVLEVRSQKSEVSMPTENENPLLLILTLKNPNE